MSGRWRRLGLLAPAVLVPATWGAGASTDAAPATARPGLLLRVARAHGLDRFDDVEAIRYTFRVRFGEREVAREWTWEPRAGRVAFRRPGASSWTRYDRGALGADAPDSLRQIDAAFVNDQYWLLMPLHLAWDDFASVEVDPDRVVPPGGGEPVRHVVVRYPQTGGYTPGDAYELFVDDDDRLVAWIYHPGGADAARAVCRWTDHRRVGPLRIALDHPGVDGRFRVWFTDVAVKVRGREGWVGPE